MFKKRSAERKDIKQKQREDRKKNFNAQLSKTLQTTAKQLVWLFSINGILWIWCSYILAFMDKGQIAESLSSNVCTVVLGQIAFYLISKTVENVFKYNNFGGEPFRENHVQEEIYHGESDGENQDFGGGSIEVPDIPEPIECPEPDGIKFDSTNLT